MQPEPGGGNPDPPYQLQTLTRRQLMKETIETHRAVTNAILKGDSVGARCAMIMHLTYNRQKLLELLEAQEKDLEGRKEGE